MKNRDILNAMGDIDFDMIEDAGRVTQKNSMRRKVAKWSSLAACVCLIFVGVAMIFKPDVSQPGVSQDCEAYGAFSNLDDFYTFATTGSRDASKYTDSYTAREVYRYNSIDVSALLKVDEMFKDILLTDEIKEIHIHEDNYYCYVFESGMTMTIKYNTDITSTEANAVIIREGTNHVYVMESENDRFSVDAPVNTVYVKNVDGISISRQKVKLYKTEFFSFTAYIDAFEITIHAYWGGDNSYSSLEEWMNDPKNQSIMAFFDDEKLPEAIADLKAAVEAAQRRK